MIANLALAAVLAASAASVSPDTRYDPAIPTLEQVIGHAAGTRITTPAQMAAYIEALAEAAPDRTELVTYATSEEGRPLQVLAIGSAERMARIQDVQAGLAELADPRGLAAEEMDRLVRELPAVVWLFHGVHGNEISSPEAGLALAYHLLAAQGDDEVDLIRREAVVLIDPLQNPDGRARFVASNSLGQSRLPDPEAASAEHVEPWPGGRSNHYLFDMNRDWFAQTQPESRGRLGVFLTWYPHVAVDLHEMGGNSTYFFAPPAAPRNPHLVESQDEWHDRIGRAIAARFDEQGVSYFVREVFDAFYPGYGETWPMLHGAVGMTFEQASARGLVFRRDDETELTLLDGIRNHFTAALTTTATAARGREVLLADFLAFRRSTVSLGETGSVRQYVLVPGADRAPAIRLARLLVGQGIEVRSADEELRAGDQRFPAGSFVVSLAQPAGRLVRNLLDPSVPMADDFLEEQHRRHEKRLRTQIYDVTAWSLPLVFDVECVGTGALGGSTTAWEPSEPVAQALPPAKVAWLLPWGAGTAAAVTEALQAGIKVRVTEGETNIEGKSFPTGTAIVRRAENPDDVAETLGQIAARHHATAVALDSGYPESGVSLGSMRVRQLRAPRVLLAWDTPTSSQSVGWARWVLEKRYGQRVSVVRVASLRRVELERFDVVVLPSGRWADALNESMVSQPEELGPQGGHPRRPGRGRSLAHHRGGRLALDHHGAEERLSGRPPFGRRGWLEGPGMRRPGGRALRPRDGHSARARAAKRGPRGVVAGPARPGALARGGDRRRDPGHRRQPAGVQPPEARQGPQRRGVRVEGGRGGQRPGVGRGPGAPGPEGVPHAPAAGPGTRHRLRRGPELPRLRRGHGTALHERGTTGAGLLTREW